MIPCGKSIRNERLVCKFCLRSLLHNKKSRNHEGFWIGASSVIGLGRKANKTNGFKTSKSSIYFKIIIKNELQNNALHAKWRAFFYFTEVNQHE